MRLHWLVFSVLSVFLFSTPAKAAKLLYWRFNPERNQLVFTTDEGVRPVTTIVEDPNRLIVDLPETVLGKPTVNQTFGGKISKIRVGQFDSNTTRIVLELAPGYTLDPKEVELSEKTRTQWAVNLPALERDRRTPSFNSTSRFSQRETRERSSNGSDRARELPSDLQLTETGLLVRIDGSDANQIRVRRSSDRRRIDFDIQGVIIPNSLVSKDLNVDRHGIRDITFYQTSVSPPRARIALKVNEDSPDWEAFFTRAGSLVISPEKSVSVVSSNRNFDNSSFSASRHSNSNDQSIVRSVEIVNSNSQQSELLIRSDRPISARGDWNRTRDLYEIKIFNARLAESFPDRPQEPENNPLSKVVVLENRDTQSVVILVKAASGVRIEQLNQPGDRLLALQMRRYNASAVFVNPVDPPPVATWKNPPSARANRTRSGSVPNKRLLVVIDPGHGGKDPGTIGIGGTQEKNVVLPISKMVAQLLEQQGVQVMMTRSSDYFVSLAGRTEMANRANGALFVSIHANAINLQRPDVNGLETYYYETGRGLARSIHQSMLENVNIRDRGLRRARFYVLRKSAMPSVLVEVGFLTGREDAANLQNSNHRRQVASAIANGILQYIRANGL